MAEIAKRASEMPGADFVALALNGADPNGELNDGVREEIEKSGLDLIGVVPHDEMVYEYDGEGRPTAKLPDDSPARAAVNRIAEKLFA